MDRRDQLVDARRRRMTALAAHALTPAAVRERITAALVRTSR